MFIVASYIPMTLIIWCFSMVNSICCGDDFTYLNMITSHMNIRDVMHLLLILLFTNERHLVILFSQNCVRVR